MIRAAGWAVVIVAVGTAALAAQTPPPAAPRPYVAIGCISVQPPAQGRGARATPQYIVTDYRGDKPAVFRLDGDAAKLKTHVGHTVEVAGPLTAPARGAGAAAGTPVMPVMPVMKVQTLTWISTTCQAPIKK